MSIDYPIFYKELATGMNEMLTSIGSNQDAIERVMEILKYLVDITTNVDFDARQALVDIEPIIRQKVYLGLITLPRDESQVFYGVTAVNKHTKTYIASDLTNFVNNEVWLGDCVPYEWSRASEIMGEDISQWNVCDPS